MPRRVLKTFWINEISAGALPAQVLLKSAAPAARMLVEMHKREENEMTGQDSFEKFVKDMGFVPLAKAITDAGRSYGLSEAEFVALGNKHYGRDEFTKKLQAMDDDGIAIRKAIQRIKETQFVESLPYRRPASLAPTVAGGLGAFNVNNDDRAKDLDEAVKAEMAAAPWLTVEAATMRVEAARRAAQAIADMHRPRT